MPQYKSMDEKRDCLPAIARYKCPFTRLKHLAGQTFDIVFFPVDARLEGAREWGVTYALRPGEPEETTTPPPAP